MIYPDLGYTYMNNMANDVGYTPGAPVDVVYEAHNYKKNVLEINETNMPPGGGGDVVAPYQPFQYYSHGNIMEYSGGIFGYEPGEAIARTRRNMMIAVAGIIAIIVLATIGIIVLTVIK